MTFWSCYSIGTGISVTCCQQNHQWHHFIISVKTDARRCNMTFLVIWWHWYQYHMMSLELVLFGATGIGACIMWCRQQYQCHYCILQVEMIEMRCNMTFLVMWHNWYLHWHRANVNSISNGTTAFLRSRWSKWGSIWLFGHVMPLVKELVSCNADDITNSAIAYHMSIGLNWAAIWLYGHVMPVLASHDTDGITNTTMHLSLQDDQIEMQYDFSGHVTPLASDLVSCDTTGTLNGITVVRRIKMRCNMTFGHAI